MRTFTWLTKAGNTYTFMTKADGSLHCEKG